MPERVPLLFDTDIGSDIDDAVALAYLLREPRCELLGITTVSGEAPARARLADALCRAAGRDDVPIHCGAEEPFLVGQRQPHAPQQSALSRWRHRSDFAPNTAVPFLQEVIRSRPGEVTLLAVGPFTNVGLLFTLDPEIPRLLKRLVIMGGSYRHLQSGFSRREWNTGCDPHAAARMFQAPVPELVAFGLNVTLQCQMEAAECRLRLRGGALDLVADMAEVWFGHRPQITFHDPLAAAALFEPDVCDYARGRVEVDLSNPRSAGVTHWAPDVEGPHTIAVEVRPELFFQRYFQIVQQA